ncbi:DUF7948 domain-containing protein [Rufibacter immobilis]|uniref:DUF7948 domain-containing protein n=1 Tax=Rufibacter immobilis TaxID=1348778 RepID=UPI0035E5842C
MCLSVPVFILSAFWSLLQSFLTPPAPVAPALKNATVTSAAPDARTLEFVENKGQWPQQVTYAADLPGGKMFLQATGFVYVLHEPISGAAHGKTPAAPAPTARTLPPANAVKQHAYAVTFLGANAAPPQQAQEATQGIRNYYLGKDPKNWGSGARGFRKLRYSNLYKGVDLALYEQNGQLKYDLYLAAGTSPAQIQLQYAGATSLSLQNGNLHVETSVGNIIEHTPVAFQWIRNQKVAVPCQYQLQGQTLSFHFPKGYDPQHPLLIDPVIEFASYTGSRADNWGFTATYDSKGNMYSGGIAAGTGYPASLGAFDTEFNGFWDIAIMKFNTKVSGPAARLYATYLGGLESETPHSLVVNPQDELLILGTTSSRNYPVTETAFSRGFNGGTSIEPLGSGGNPTFDNGSDIVITRLSENGDKLLASTFLGGSGNDGLLSYVLNDDLVQNYGDQFRGDIITDADGNVYIASNTASTDFPARNGFRSQPHGGGNDAIVCKLSPDLSQLLWASYVGGNGQDAAYSIQLDQDRQVYICGGTTSPTLPGTAPGLHQASAGGTDGFVLKINAAGTAVLAATFLGTTEYDQTYFLQLDASNHVYLLGQTLGSYPVSGNTYRNANGKQFLHKLSNDLSTTEWSTVFGSGRNSIDLSPTAFMVDDCQRIYVSGWGGSSNGGIYGNGTTNGLPITANAMQATTDGGDFYLLQLGANARELLYASYYGANQNGPSGGGFEHVDGGTSRFDKKGYVYQAVCGGCQSRSNFPIPLGANFYSRLNPSDNCNNAAFKFDFAEELRADAGPDDEVCADGAAVVLKGTPTGGVWSGDGVTLENGVYRFTPSPALAGPRTLTYTVMGTGSCAISKSMVMNVTQVAAHSITLPAEPLCVGASAPVQMAGSPAGGVFSGKGVTGSTFNPAVAGPGKHTITYRSDGSNGFCGLVTKEVEVLAPTLSIGPDTTLCPGNVNPFQLRASVPGGTWSGDFVSSTGYFSPPLDFTGTVEVTYSAALPCPVTGTKKINLPPRPTMQAWLDNSCKDNPKISGYAPFNASFANTTNATGFTWHFGDGTQSTERTPRHLYQQPGKYSVTLVAHYGANCQETLPVGDVIVEPPFVPNIFTPNGDDKNDTFVQFFSCFPTEIIVYNVWGKQVYQEKIYNQKWDGGSLSEGTYFYILKDTEGNSAKGWVEILR